MYRLLGEHGIQQDDASGRQEFERRMAETDEAALKTFRRGWCVGGAEFKRELLETMEGKLGDHHAGDLRRETAAAQAGRIVAEELARLGWAESDLASRRKNDPAKLKMAARLQAETTLAIKAIAHRIHLGTSKSANIWLHEWMKRAARDT